jgi:hypothetical protein
LEAAAGRPQEGNTKADVAGSELQTLNRSTHTSTHGLHWHIEQKPHRYKLMPEIAGLRWRNEVCIFRRLEGPKLSNLVPRRRIDAAQAAIAMPMARVSGRYI